MDPAIWAVILLLISLVLLFAEVLIPSGGLIFLASMVFLAAAIWSAWSAWWEAYPVIWWVFVASIIVLLPASVSAAIFVWPHTPIGKMAEPPTEAEVTAFAEEQKRLAQLIGQVGETLTPLSPAGITRVGGQRVHSLSEGMIVPRGTAVRVLAVQGNRVVVRRAEAAGGESAADKSLPAGPETGPTEVSPLDFDLPPG
jgi:membrane-bound ClpP family serine protease